MENTNLLNKEAWNAYQKDYMKFHLMRWPDYFEFFSNGGVMLDSLPPLSLIGDVKGLKLLDTCCACDAKQAFSWHNLGAVVTACDITPKAIEIASANAAKMNLSIEFVVADMQKLEPIGDNQYDIVFATYPCWVQDINEACRNWHRILKTGGRLLLNMPHPIMDCIEADENGLIVNEDYNNPVSEIDGNFGGTPLADRFGGWSVDLPSVCNMYRISDILNAICDAGFTIKKTHESNNESPDNIYLSRLPSDFAVLAVKCG